MALNFDGYVASQVDGKRNARLLLIPGHNWLVEKKKVSSFHIPGLAWLTIRWPERTQLTHARHEGTRQFGYVMSRNAFWRMQPELTLYHCDPCPTTGLVDYRYLNLNDLPELHSQ